MSENDTEWRKRVEASELITSLAAEIRGLAMRDDSVTWISDRLMIIRRVIDDMIAMLAEQKKRHHPLLTGGSP